MDLRGYVYDDAGNAVSGATIEVYAYGSSTPVASTTTGADGSWSVTNLASGQLYRVKAAFGGLVRWLESDQKLQLALITGADGATAPLGNLSVTNAMLQDGSVTEAKIASTVWYFNRARAGGVTIYAVKAGQLEFVEGEGIVLKGDNTSKRVTISSSRPPEEDYFTLSTV